MYQESDLVIRTIRDVYNTDIDRIICDNASDRAEGQGVPRHGHAPRQAPSSSCTPARRGCSTTTGWRRRSRSITSRRVALPCGGSLVIDQTEALVAIDVNSGRFREHTDAETTALRINIEAATEVARQLRLRDLGGVIIIDFIDMREEKPPPRSRAGPARGHEERPGQDQDPAHQPLRHHRDDPPADAPLAEGQHLRPCPACGGTGHLKSEESLSLEIMRLFSASATSRPSRTSG